MNLAAFAGIIWSKKFIEHYDHFIYECRMCLVDTMCLQRELKTCAVDAADESDSCYWHDGCGIAPAF